MEIKDLSKSQLGTIGEYMVAANILGQGWDAILANMSINNIESYDIVCVKPHTGKTALVQVKTSVGKNIPIGFKLKESITEILEKKIIGPWVFVNCEKNDVDEYYFRYFILSRSEMIQLTNDSNYWYVHQWKDSYRKKTVDDNNPTGLSIRWLEGKGEDDNNRHYAFVNPLTDSSENQWDKIWED